MSSNASRLRTLMESNRVSTGVFNLTSYGKVQWEN